MDEYINRAALLAGLDGIWDCSDIVFPNGRDHICKVPEECKGCKWRDVLAAFKEMVKCTPAADVEPVRHGRWEVQNCFWRKHSECGETWHEQWVMGKALKYCPNCGAHMDEEVTQDG